MNTREYLSKLPNTTYGKAEAKAPINHSWSSPTSYCINVSHSQTTKETKWGLVVSHGLATSTPGFLLPGFLFSFKTTAHVIVQSLPTHILLCVLFALTSSHHT